MPHRFWPIYERLEQEFEDLAFNVELTDAHLGVYSVRSADFLIRLGAEAEAITKYLVIHDLEAGNGRSVDEIRRLSFPALGATLLASTVFGDISSKSVRIRSQLARLSTVESTRTPFASWSPPTPTNPLWFSTYNKVKHERPDSIELATLRTVLDAMAGVFILNCLTRVVFNLVPQSKVSDGVYFQHANDWSRLFWTEDIIKTEFKATGRIQRRKRE